MGNIGFRRSGPEDTGCHRCDGVFRGAKNPINFSGNRTWNFPGKRVTDRPTGGLPNTGYANNTPARAAGEVEKTPWGTGHSVMSPAAGVQEIIPGGN